MANTRTQQIIRIVAVVLAVVILAAFVGSYMFYRDLTRGPLPKHDGELEVSGLNDTVQVLRDERGIPQIYAGNLHDLFFAQGFTQAQDRWWQMELYRHAGSGTVGELVGKNDDALEMDVLARTMGWRQLAEVEFDLLDNETRTTLQDFADGVNAYITSRSAEDLAVEYGVLRLTGKKIKVEPWTPVDTLVWSKIMAWNLGPIHNTEEIRAKLYVALGQEMTDRWLTNPWPYAERPTILQTEDIPGITSDSGAAIAGASGLSGEFVLAGSGILPDVDFFFGKGSGIGSNNWVVSGNLTESGKPLLANDPHMAIQMPSIWYEIGLHCQSPSGETLLDVTGFSFTSMPGIVIGHNGSIAWGVTNNGADVADLYSIRVNPDNQFQYEWNGAWRDMTVRQETIHRAGSSKTTTIQVRETHLGPIINDNKLDEETGELKGLNTEDPMALHWTALQPSTIARSVILLNKAGNWNEFRGALQYWDVPSQNFVYADVDGNIGYQMPGRIPIRAGNHTGLLPVPGWTDEYEWQGYIPFDSLPAVLNPEQGYIVTANQAVVPLAYFDKLAQELGEGRNYVFSREHDFGYRAQRINDLLEATDKHTVDSFRSIQGDNRSLSASEVMPYLAGLELSDEELDGAREWLLEWDFDFDMESAQAALFSTFWERLLDNLFNDQLSKIKINDKELHAYSTDADMRAVYLLLHEPDNAWWDDADTPGIVESRDDILLRAFREGYRNAKEELGNDRNKWEWGKLHTATFVSLPLGVSGTGFIEDMVNEGPYEVGGTMVAVNATSWVVEEYGEEEDFSVDYLPSMRIIVDLSDLTDSVTINTTGQSGHPYSAQYKDQINPWRHLEYHPMLWSQGQVETSAVDRLILTPRP